MATLISESIEIAVVLPAELLAPDGELDVRVSMPDSVSPRQLGINDDPRVLGVGLKTLRIFE